jgi:hypothetical protein
MAFDSAEFQFLIPALAASWQNRSEYPFRRFNAAEIARFLLFLGNMESWLEAENRKCIRNIPSSARKNESPRSDVRVLLGPVLASLV